MIIPFKQYQFAGVLGIIMMIIGIVIIFNCKDVVAMLCIPFIMGSLMLLAYTLIHVFENNIVRFKE